MAAPVEAPVDRRLDAATGRLEQRRHRQGRSRHGQAGVPAEQLTQAQSHHGIGAAEQDREQPVGQGAADDPVQVVQPVAQDRRADRQRQQRHAHPGRQHDQDRPRGAHDDSDQEDRRRRDGQGGRERHPAKLLALHPAGAAVAHHQRPDSDHQAADRDRDGHGDRDPHRPGQGGRGDLVDNRVIGRDHQAWPDRERQQEDDRSGRRQPGPPAPAGRWQRSARGEQQHQADAHEPQVEGRGAEDGQPTSGGERSRPGQEPIARVAIDHSGRRHCQPQHQQQPADRVAWSAAGEDRPDRHRDQRGDHRGEGDGVKLGQLGPARLTQQVIEPGDRGHAEQGQHPQRPRQPGRPPARPCRPSSGVHRHDPRRMRALRLRSPSASSVTRPVWPASVPRALRTTDYCPSRLCGTGS